MQLKIVENKFLKWNCSLFKRVETLSYISLQVATRPSRNIDLILQLHSTISSTAFFKEGKWASVQQAFSEKNKCNKHVKACCTMPHNGASGKF